LLAESYLKLSAVYIKRTWT